MDRQDEHDSRKAFDDSLVAKATTEETPFADSLGSQVESQDEPGSDENPSLDIVGAGLMSTKARKPLEEELGYDQYGQLRNSPKPRTNRQRVDDTLQYDDLPSTDTENDDAAESLASDVLRRLGVNKATTAAEDSVEDALRAKLGDLEESGEKLSEQERTILANVKTLIDQLNEMAGKSGDNVMKALTEEDRSVIETIEELVDKILAVENGGDDEEPLEDPEMQKALREQLLARTEPLLRMMAVAKDQNQKLALVSRRLGVKMADPRRYELTKGDRELVELARKVGKAIGSGSLGTGVEIACRHVHRNEDQLGRLVGDLMMRLPPDKLTDVALGDKYAPLMEKAAKVFAGDPMGTNRAPSDQAHAGSRAMAEMLLGRQRL